MKEPEMTAEAREMYRAAGVNINCQPATQWRKPRWKATDADLQEFARLARGEDVEEPTEASKLKPRPPPIVLCPARLDNESQFPNAVGHVDPEPDFPPLGFEY